MRRRYNFPRTETEAGSRWAQRVRGRGAECSRATVAGRSLACQPAPPSTPRLAATLILYLGGSKGLSLQTTVP